MLPTYRFLRPTRTYHELAILDQIGRDAAVSQRGLARAARISATMVNAYIDDFVGRGLLDVSGETNRSYRYALTAEGEAWRRQLAAEAAREVTRFFEEFREDFRLLPEPPPGVARPA